MSEPSLPASVVLGAELIRRGWRQGTLFDAPWSRFRWSREPVDPSGDGNTQGGERRIKGDEELILVSQDCDIRAAPYKEKYVEALVCKADQRLAPRVGPNSASWFVVDSRRGLIAVAAHRIVVEKAALLPLEPRPWSGTSERLGHFTRWLGKRYDRPAIPDELYEIFQRPVEALLNNLRTEAPEIGSAFTRSVHELRVSMPTRQEPPFDVELTFLVCGDGVTIEESDAIDRVAEVIRNGLTSREVDLREILIRTEDELSMQQYFNSRPLFLEGLTYEGDDIIGAEPKGRI